MVMILLDTISVHAGSVDDPTGQGAGRTLLNWERLFSGPLRSTNFTTPLANTLVMSVLACCGAVIYGGAFAYLVTRTNLKFKAYLSTIFIFPYIMPQWTLAVVWNNLFTSREVTGGSDGLVASLTGIHFPVWLAQGVIPSAIVLGLHYAPFAYILIGAIFRNMDANLEEAATILNTPRWKTFTRITLPMVTPAVLSTVLLVFSSSMGSYPVPHYLNLSTLATKYVDMSVNRQGQASILAVTMVLFGVALMISNQLSTSGRRSFTTVTGKSGQTSLVNLGRRARYVIASAFLATTLVTAIFPIILFAFETFLPNPGDYSVLKTGDLSNLTAKWWISRDNSDGAMFGQYGILFNSVIWGAVGRTLLVALFTALAAGTIGMLVGYCVSKNRRSRWANWVNSMAFMPYLMPSLAVGVAFFIFGSNIGIFNTTLLLVIAGTVKYIPFASRASLNSMLQLSHEIEESAIIQDIPWRKRMTRIIIPIQKSAIISGYMLPFMSTLRELTLFMMLVSQTKIVTTLLDYYDEMGLYAFSSAINLILIALILVFNAAVNKLTGASLDKGLGGN
ncbi:ABC transporter permease [Brachybacterium alimentarium]|uniref:ABC transporter permease n=1 Tax=Brachybacterium alimentarium TaxID=47845 RepID=UPI003FD23A6F